MWCFVVWVFIGPSCFHQKKKKSEAQVFTQQNTPFSIDPLTLLHGPSATLVLPLTSDFLFIVLTWTFIFVVTICGYLGNLKPKRSVCLSRSRNGRDLKLTCVKNSASRFHTGFKLGISFLTVLANQDSQNYYRTKYHRNHTFQYIAPFIFFSFACLFSCLPLLFSLEKETVN